MSSLRVYIYIYIYIFVLSLYLILFFFLYIAIVPPSMFYLAVNIYNKYGGEIILKASDNQPSDQLIPVGGVAQLTKDIPNQQPVEFEAFDAKIPEKRLSIDNKKLVSITPSTVKGAPHNLEVQDGMITKHILKNSLVVCIPGTEFLLFYFFLHYRWRI